ncbi:MAG: hypothetical protein Q4F54_05325 [Coriobacteriia bacterium]|nr:hypothetical protein [Coriobacteriia bacterium]
MTVSVAGGNVTKPKNYGDTELISSYELGELAPAPSDLHITYQ